MCCHVLGAGGSSCRGGLLHLSGGGGSDRLLVKDQKGEGLNHTHRDSHPRPRYLSTTEDRAWGRGSLGRKVLPGERRAGATESLCGLFSSSDPGGMFLTSPQLQHACAPALPWQPEVLTSMLPDSAPSPPPPPPTSPCPSAPVQGGC